MKSFGLLVFIMATMGIAAFAQKTAKVTTVVGIAMANDRRLSRGMWVLNSEIITTQANSKVKLLLPDGSLMDVGPNSSISIEQGTAARPETREIAVALTAGSVRALISKRKEEKKDKFTFKTKWGVMAIRGTEFVLSDQNVSVLEGSVEVIPKSEQGQGQGEDTTNKTTRNDEGNFTLSAGKTFEASTGLVRSISSEQISTIRNDTIVKERFFSAVVSGEKNGAVTTVTQRLDSYENQSLPKEMPVDKIPKTIGNPIESAQNPSVIADPTTNRNSIPNSAGSKNAELNDPTAGVTHLFVSFEVP